MNQPVFQKNTHSRNNGNQWEGPRNFETKINALYEAGDVKSLVAFLEEFSLNYPLYRGFIRQAYDQMSKLGHSALANEFARIYTETCSQLLNIGRHKFGLPTVFEFNHRNEVNNEIVEQAAYTKVQLQLGRLTTRPVLAIREKKNCGFTLAFSPYLEDSFELISKNDAAVSEISIVAQFAPYVPLFYKFSDTQYGHNSNFFVDCHADLISNNISPYSFELKDVTIEKATQFLKSYGLKGDDQFVVLYIREEGYFDNPQFNNGKVNPKDFIESVDYFLQQGLKVVRIGDSGMTPIYERLGFIDLTSVETPDEVDIFLCGRAQFYFGSGSGPISLASNFGVPCCETARIDYAGTKIDSFTQFLIFEDTITKSKCTFSDIEALGLKSNFSLKPFFDRGLTPCPPSSLDNLQFAKESLDYLSGGKIFKLNETQSSHREQYNVWGGMSSDSLPFLEPSENNWSQAIE